MKQLKCIVNNYSVVENNGLIDINFQQSIEIAPNSSIALDKISMEVLPNPGGLITIESPQTIRLTTQLSGAKKTVAKEFTLPPGKYTYNNPSNLVGEPDLLKTLNNLSNGVLNGIPELASTATTPELDYGLGFKWTGILDGPIFKVTLHAFQQLYAGQQGSAITLNNQALITSTMTAVGTSGYAANIVGDYYAYTAGTLIQGCMNCQVNCRIKNNANDSFNYGLCFPPSNTEAPTIRYGIRTIDGKVYIINNGVQGVELDTLKTPTDSATATDIFYIDNLKIWFYTDLSSDTLRMCFSVSNTIKFTTPEGTFTGYDFNLAYRLGVVGTTTAINIVENSTRFLLWRPFLQPNTTVDEIGTLYETLEPKPDLYLSKENLEAGTPERLLQLDFTLAPLLIQSLGFKINILQGSISSTAPLIINATHGIDFFNYYDIAVDILNLALETYVGSSGTNISSNKSDVFYKGVMSGKKNTIAYLLIQRLNQGESIFFNEAKQLNFLSLENKEPLNISSLQFRIYNVGTQLPINFSTASFNLFIQ